MVLRKRYKIRDFHVFVDSLTDEVIEYAVIDFLGDTSNIRVDNNPDLRAATVGDYIVTERVPPLFRNKYTLDKVPRS